MEQESFRTPNKMFTSPKFRLLNQATGGTPSSIHKKNREKFHIIPIVNSSPHSRFPNIINPFEQHLAERLHLPVICSPSLFQRPTTPRHNSTQFEWTIDDVSSLAPANVEVSELQYQQVNDPELEERAQAAINSYFKENEIVPSPVDCPLRNQKIILNNDSSYTVSSMSGSYMKNKERMRDGFCQTEITFPPILPKDLEILLAPFCTYTQDQQQSATLACDTSVAYETRDASLRRKLFGNIADSSSDCGHDSMTDIDLQALSPPPKTPEISKFKSKTRNFGTPLSCNTPRLVHKNSPNISISPVKKENFGSLSPITRLSPAIPSNKRILVADVIEKENRDTSDSSLFQSTPEKLRKCEGISIVSSTEMCIETTQRSKNQNFAIEMSCADEKTVDWDNSYEEHVTSSSQRQKNFRETPNRRTRISSKNLSLSFSMCPDDEDENNMMDINPQMVNNVITDRKSSSFYRTDSGFNEPSSGAVTFVDESSNHKVFQYHSTLDGHFEENHTAMDISMKSDIH